MEPEIGLIDEAEVISLDAVRTGRGNDGLTQSIENTLQELVDTLGPVELFTALEHVTHQGHPLVGRKLAYDFETARRLPKAYWVSHAHPIPKEVS